MPTPAMKELRDFHQFLGEKLVGGDTDVTPEEALDQWRQSHPDEESSKSDLEAIREALDDMANGDRGIPFEEFDAEFRRRHNIPT